MIQNGFQHVEKDLKANLKLLNGLNPALRKEIGAEFREIGKPIAEEISANKGRQNFPRGFQHRGRTGAIKTKKIKVDLNTRKARNRNANNGADYETLAVLRLMTRDAATAIGDMAGARGRVQKSGRSRPYPGREKGHALKGQGAKMIEALNKKPGGRPSRMMWRTTEKHRDEIDRKVVAVLQKLERHLNDELGKIGATLDEIRGMRR
jgi:hypothetical protein